MVDGLSVLFFSDGAGVGAIGDWLTMLVGSWVEYTDGMVDGEDTEVGLRIPIEGLLEGPKVFATDGVDVGGR